MLSIETMDNRPWVPHHIPNPIRAELYRRTLNNGMNYVDVNTNWSNYKNYRGPLASWVKVTSNGNGTTKYYSSGQEKRDGFIMYGGTGFESSYGRYFDKKYLPGILGYDVLGNAHTLDYSKYSNSQHAFPFIACPGIESIEASIQKERIRKVTINWKCHSFAQLQYMTPYFLTPGISLIVEFGWNLFNPESLLNLSDISNLTKLWADGTPLYQSILKSNGMYDVTFGSVANFEINTTDGIVYNCKTELFSKHRNHTGALLHEAPTNSTIIVADKIETMLSKPSLFEFCSQRLKNVVRCLEGDGKNFFEPLTPEEQNKIENSENGVSYDNSKLIKNFNNGKKENRIFVGRNKIKNDPLRKFSAPEFADWDVGSHDGIWVTMGFVVDLLNVFISQKVNTFPVKLDDTSENDKYSLYKFNIDDVVIGGHPNLISCDGDKILIPNPKAPKYNLGHKFWVSDYSNPEENYFQMQTSNISAASFVKEKEFKNSVSEDLKPDIKIYNIFKTGYISGFGTPYNVIFSDFEKKLEEFEKKNPPPPYYNYMDRVAAFEKENSKNKLINFSLNQISSNNSTSLPQFNSAKDVTEGNDRGAYRDDIDIVINRFRYSINSDINIHSAAFPQMQDYTEKGNYVRAGYWGYLKDIYVNINVIISAAQNCKTAEEFLSVLLNEVSSGVAGYWELAVVEDENELKIVDKKFINKNIYQNIFQFDIGSNSIIKNLSFTVTPSNAQMTQIIAGSRNNQTPENQSNTGQSTSNILPDFRYGDRLGVNQLEPETKKTFMNESSDMIKQLQKYGKVPGSFIMTLKETEEFSSSTPSISSATYYAANYYNFYSIPTRKENSSSKGEKFKKLDIINLALPSKSLLLSLLDCEDYENNTNMYCGQQPNFTCELTLQGISGIRTFQCFSIKNLPSPYSPDEVIFSVLDVTHTVQRGEWITVIKAGIRPKIKLKNSSTGFFTYSMGKEAFELGNNAPLMSNLR